MKIRQNDLLPPMKANAFTDSGPVTLATTFTGGIVFRMVHTDGTVVTGAATGDDLGNLTYNWAAGNTTKVGIYAAVFIGTVTAGAKPQTFPTDSNLVVEIIAAI